MIETTIQIACVILLAGYPVWRLTRDWSSSFWLMPAFMLTAAVGAVDILMLANAQHFADYVMPSLILQGMLCPAWLMFSLTYARQGSEAVSTPFQKLQIGASLIPLVSVLAFRNTSLFFSPDFSVDRVLFLEPVTFFFHLLEVLILLLCLGNLEVTLRNARHGERWKVKLSMVGAGVVIVAHVLYFSQAFLQRAIDVDYLTLRLAGSALGVAMIAFAEITRESHRVTINGRMAFRSLAVVVAGMYLFGIGIIGEGSKYFGSSFQRHALISVAFLAGLAILLVCLSERVRRKLRIVLHRHFYNEKYDYRSQWMEFSGNLSQVRDTPGLLGMAARSFCETFGFVGGALLCFDNEHKGEIRYAIYHEVYEPAPEMDTKAFFSALQTLCASPAEPMAITDVKNAPQIVLDGMQHMHTTHFVPLMAGEELEGVMLLGPPIDSGEEYTVEDFELMEALGRQVGVSIRSFRLGDELAVAREMEAVGRVSTFVMHDLKNQVYSLSLLADNAREYINDSAFQKDMLDTLDNSVTNFKVLISQLNHIPDKSNLRLEPCDLLRITRKAVKTLAQPQITVTGDPVTVTADAEQIEKVVLNLCLNAVEVDGEKPVSVVVGNNGVPFFEVSDSGGGIAESMLNGDLFSPFRTTKKRGMGIGLYHCRKIMDAHGGSIEVRNRPGEGATFKVSFDSAEQILLQSPLSDVISAELEGEPA